MPVSRSGRACWGSTWRELIAWQGATTLAGPLAAAIAAFVASRRGTEGERRAWRNFCIGSGLYFLGNVGYLALALVSRTPVFPSLAEAAFFVMALFFAAGMLQFTQVRNRFGTVQIYNFALIYCAVALSAIFVLNHTIANSVMSPMATVVAFLYPALWWAVAAFGVVSIALYAYGRKSVAYGLMVLAVLAEAVADGRYALALMNGTYEIGGVTQLLWISSSALIVWSALEQIVATRQSGAAREERTRAHGATGRSRRRWSLPLRWVRSSFPARCPESLAGRRSRLSPHFSQSPLRCVAGLREHWIINMQRQLRRTVEQSREELAASRMQLEAVLESTHDSVLVITWDWRVAYWNRHAPEIIKLTHDKLKVGVSLWELFPNAATSGEGDQYKRVLETGVPAEFELFLPDQEIWLGISAFPSQEGISVFFRDISEQKRARDEILHLAHHDPLTGLANRALFQTQLDRCTGPKRRRCCCSTSTIFKEVNDTLGHPVGDVLLVSVANRLREVLGAQVTIARLGGDEFAATPHRT